MCVGWKKSRPQSKERLGAVPGMGKKPEFFAAAKQERAVEGLSA